MPYQLFYTLCPEEAERETRVVQLFAPHPFTGVPPGEYNLLESFCNEADCDCRRVMWMVTSEREQCIVAVVAYGWGSPKFYRNWYGADDPDTIREMRGPILNLASQQGPYARGILDMVTKVVLKDKP